ncbi:MAG: hypothetical protein D8M59_03570 [Planctomycetes bacterium]|nr:hypothetical protein [Planctomycetota bacterium]NOG53077.1 hypothetical protein [Planctomycetota bacterium]
MAIDAAIRRVRQSSSAVAPEAASHRESYSADSSSARSRNHGRVALAVLQRLIPQRIKSAGAWLVHNMGEFVGGAGSYERGFVAAAVVLVIMLGAARLILGSTPVVGALVPMLALTGVLAYRLRRMSFQSARLPSDEQPAPKRWGKWINTRWKAAMLGIVCAPLLTHVLKPMSPAKSHRAFIWTCWLAFLVGSFGMALSATGATVN